MTKKTLILKPGEKIPQDILGQLKLINKNRPKNGFPLYKQQIANLFCIDGSKPITHDEILFLGGFVEGEGSINVSLKPASGTISGVTLDLNFRITQHVNGMSLLYLALRHFATGTIRHKGDTSATMFFEIGDRQSIRQKVVPFFEKVVGKHGSAGKRLRFQKFENLLTMLEQRQHSDQNILLNQMLPIWDELRMQRGQLNQGFESLAEAQQFIKDCWGQTKERKTELDNQRKTKEK